MDCLKSVAKSFYYFSRFILPVGLGARTVLEGETETSNLFAMTSDFSDPFVENQEQLINCYEGTLKSVKLALPILFKNVIKFVCDLAQNEVKESGDIKNVSNYFVLILMMAGMIDDFQDSLNEMLKAASLPVSVIVIKVGNTQPENDSEKFIKNAFPAFLSAERVYIDLLDFDKYKNEQGQHT